MKRLFLLFCSVVIMLSACSQKVRYYTINGTAQGTTFHIVFKPVIATDSSFAAVRDTVQAILDRIDLSVSGYNTASCLTSFNEQGTEIIDKIFLDNFVAAKRMYEESGGLFDASAAPLFDLWGFGFRAGMEVTSQMVDSVRQFIGMEHFTVQVLQAANGQDSILLRRSDERCRLNFNAIAQGYTADCIADKFTAMGIENFLIEIGGEIFAKGVNARGLPWAVGIDCPVDGNNTPGAVISAIVNIQDKGLVTSGDYRKFYLKDGKKISHSINPKTGYPVQHNLLSVTVMADNATIADGYATYLMVLGYEEARNVVEKNENIEALLIFSEGDSMKIWKSEGMNIVENSDI